MFHVNKDPASFSLPSAPLICFYLRPAAPTLTPPRLAVQRLTPTGGGGEASSSPPRCRNFTILPLARSPVCGSSAPPLAFLAVFFFWFRSWVHSRRGMRPLFPPSCPLLF